MSSEQEKLDAAVMLGARLKREREKASATNTAADNVADKENIVEKGPREALLEKGYQVADELTAHWNQFLDAEKNDPSFALLAEVDGDGRKLFESFIEGVDEEVVKHGRSAEDILQEGVNAIDALRDRATEILNEKKQTQVEKKEDPLVAALESAREEYADIRYRDDKAVQRIRKLLNRSSEGKHEELQNVREARERYEKALNALREDRITKLKEGNLSSEDAEKRVRELFTFFNHKEKLEFYDAKTKAKMAELVEIENKNIAEKTWDKISLRATQLAEWYSKKVPTAVKVGLGIAAFASGGGAFAAGKRMWGSVIMAASLGTQLDKIAQFKDGYFDEKESNKLIENISSLNGENEKSFDFDRLNDVLNEKIKEMDKALKKHAIRSKINNFAAFAGGAILGGSALAGILNSIEGVREAGGVGAFFGKILHYDADINAEEMAGGDGGDAPYDPNKVNPKYLSKNTGSIGGVSSAGGVNSAGGVGPDGVRGGFTPSTNAYEHGMTQGAHSAFTPSTNAYEHAPAAPTAGVELPKETMTVHKGSNFIATLKKEYLDKHRDEFIKLNPKMAKFNNDQIAFRLAKAYGDKHLDGHLPDLVKAGAKMTFDPKTMEVNFLKPGDASFYHEHAVRQATGATKLADVPNLNIKDTMAVNLEDLSKSPVPVAEETLSKSEVAKVVQGNIVEAKADYAKAANEALLHPAGSDGPSMTQMEEMGRADKALQQGAEYIKNNSDFYPETTKQAITIQRAIASNDLEFWSEIQDLEYDQAVADKRIGSKLELIKRQFEKEYGTRRAFTPKEGETLRKWTMRVSNAIMEKRYKIAA